MPEIEYARIAAGDGVVDDGDAAAAAAAAVAADAAGEVGEHEIAPALVAAAAAAAAAFHKHFWRQLQRVSAVYELRQTRCQCELVGRPGTARCQE